MARCHLAEWKPLGDDYTHQPPMVRVRGLVVHTMVGSLDGTDAYFRQGGYVGTESHYGVGYHDGQVAAYQWTDTYRQADANLYGNPTLISMETADMGAPFAPYNGDDAPPWTDDQMDLMAKIIAYHCRLDGIPPKFMGSSLPTATGIGYHRLGIDSVPAGKPGWRKPGGELWSTSKAKTCPTDTRIAQFHSELLPAIQTLVAGTPWPDPGDHGPAVHDLQVKLHTAGYYHADYTDTYDDTTKDAVAALQGAQGWSGSGADGVIGPETWKVIQAIPDTPNDPPTTHPDVFHIQQLQWAANHAAHEFLATHPNMPRVSAAATNGEAAWAGYHSVTGETR